MKLLGYVTPTRVGSKIYLHYQCYSTSKPNSATATNQWQGIGVCLAISEAHTRLARA